MVYLRVKTEIKELTDAEGWVNFIDDICPSQIVPSVEFIENAQRSLGGKLHVDVVATKQSLQIVFDVLTQQAFNTVKQIFNTQELCSNGLEVEYFDIEQIAKKRYFHVEGITFNPLVLDDGIMWREVTIDLVEI